MTYQCEVNDGLLEPCEFLMKVLDGGRKGLIFHMLSNIKTGKESRSFVAINSGEYVVKGIVANYCPLCGASIGKHMMPPDENEEMDVENDDR